MAMAQQQQQHTSTRTSSTGIGRRELLAWLLVTCQCLFNFYLLIFQEYDVNGCDNSDVHVHGGEFVDMSGANPMNNNLRSVILEDTNDKLDLDVGVSSGAPVTSLTRQFTDDVTGETVVRTFYAKPKGGLDALQGGNCWCTASPDNFCSCTPSLAIDVVLASGSSHVWLIQRKDTGKYATMGGFVEVGETTEEAVARELFEETSITLSSPPKLFGLYSDPQRDWKRHRHSVSVVYVVDIPESEQPHAGDDAQDVIRVALEDIDKLDFFIDHKTVFLDYRHSITGSRSSSSMLEDNRDDVDAEVDVDHTAHNTGTDTIGRPVPVTVSYDTPFKRTVCHDARGGYMPEIVQ
jgi:8-oxo-dGTP diphosphatase